MQKIQEMFTIKQGWPDCKKIFFFKPFLMHNHKIQKIVLKAPNLGVPLSWSAGAPLKQMH